MPLAKVQRPPMRKPPSTRRAFPVGLEGPGDAHVRIRSEKFQRHLVTQPASHDAEDARHHRAPSDGPVDTGDSLDSSIQGRGVGLQPAEGAWIEGPEDAGLRQSLDQRRRQPARVVELSLRGPDLGPQRTRSCDEVPMGGSTHSNALSVRRGYSQ